MKRSRLSILLTALAAICAASSPLAAATGCLSTGRWRAPGSAAYVNANAQDKADGWQAISVKYSTKREGGSYGDDREWLKHPILLDGKRKLLWDRQRLASTDKGFVVNRVQILFDSLAGTKLVCAVHFEARKRGLLAKDEARFSSAACWDQDGANVPIGESSPYVTCERRFDPDPGYFTVVLRLKDQP